MEIVSRVDAGIPIAKLSGRFDAFEVPQLVQWLDANINEKQKNAVVNLEGVEFIDSSGLSALVKGLKRCREVGGELNLCALRQVVVIIFELTRLDKAFHIFETEQAALETLTNHSA